MTTLTETRAALILKREAVGADTPRGAVISGVIEQLQNLPSYVRPPWAKDERQTLPYALKRALKHLSRPT